MTHDQQNDRNEKWLRSVLDGLTASNSSAESMAQKLYAFAHAYGEAPAVTALKAVVRKGTNGRWYTSQHGDTDVTNIVGSVL